VVTDLIVGRYEILEELGEKKKAIDRLTGREVVVRSKHLEAAPQAELLERLVRLRHPNLAGFLHHFPLDGELWMVTEFVDGRTLESLLAEAVPVDSAKARAWMQGLAEGTMAAHEAGFLVGQLSPSKAVIGAGSGIKLLDAGLDGMAASGSGVQNEVSTLTAIYRRMLGEAGATNTALGKMEAAQNCSDFLTALKEVEAPAPTVGITPDRKLLPPTSKKPLFFRKWDRRHVIAIIATVIGIMVGYKMATHGQSGSGYVGRWIERMR
jgi:serine/threonine protein kinase